MNVDVEPMPSPGPYTGILFPLLTEKQAPEISSEPCCQNQTSDTIIVLDTVTHSQEDTLDNAVDNAVDITVDNTLDNNIDDSVSEIVSGDVV